MMQQRDSASKKNEVAGFADLRRALTKLGYQGEIADELSRRIVYSTDNSIYQVVPNWIAIPATIAVELDDVQQRLGEILVVIDDEQRSVFHSVSGGLIFHPPSVLMLMGFYITSPPDSHSQTLGLEASVRVRRTQQYVK